MGKALYRKYRSRTLDDIVDQDHIVKTLKNALKSDKISHAYLFTGPRGVGKTSIARLFAHAVNKFDYDESRSLPVDIIEIDAASNRRIDEVRDIRESVRLAPIQAKYKVYIIDEVHMLTKEAFNALLKTLEEPPEHVIFILATTEAHKLPETITSRTQQFNFKAIDSKKAAEHLKTIAKQENISITDEALAEIAEHGSGSFRDAISLLDQLRHHNDKITQESVLELLGLPPDQAIKELAQTIEQSSPSELVSNLTQLQANGFQAVKVAKQLSELFRQQLIDSNNSINDQDLLDLLKLLADIKGSDQPYQDLELALLETVLKNNKQNPNASKTVSREKPDDLVPDTPKSVKAVQPIDDSTWQEVLHQLKAKHNTLYGIARMASVSLNDEEVKLGFKFPFHKRRFEESKNNQIIKDIFFEISGNNVSITCFIDENLSVENNQEATEQPENSATLDSITKVFGGGEVLD